MSNVISIVGKERNGSPYIKTEELTPVEQLRLNMRVAKRNEQRLRADRAKANKKEIKSLKK